MKVDNFSCELDFKVKQTALTRTKAHSPIPGRTTGEHRESGKISRRSPGETGRPPRRLFEGLACNTGPKIT